MDQHGIAYRQQSNAFVWIEDCPWAQKFADRFEKKNWIKRHSQYGCVLRVETVISNPREFKVRRRGMRRSEEVMRWFPMPKGVENMPRYREIALAANSR
jgi:hypothetical protein